MPRIRILALDALHRHACDLKRLLLKYHEKSISSDFIILSNNCWGMQLYQDLQKPYNTPFVGCYIYPSDYLSLLQGFPSLLLEEDIMINNESRYEGITCHAVGHLGQQIEIHFYHYKNIDEAYSKYQRRLTRMMESLNSHNTKLLIKFDDRLGANDEHFELFSRLPNHYQKVSFSARELDYCTNISLGSYSEISEVPDGYSLYSARYLYFDLAYWITRGEIKSTFFSRLFALLSKLSS